MARQNTRKRTPGDIEASVLVKSARRCPACFHLNGDLAQKHGQIAHLDQNRGNAAEDNLCFMCISHHSEYDSTTSQHKNFTMAEVKAMRTSLYEAIADQKHHRLPTTIGNGSNANFGSNEIAPKDTSARFGDSSTKWHEGEESVGLVPLYAYHNQQTDDYFYTTDYNELNEAMSGYRTLLDLGRVFNSQVRGTVRVHRFINETTRLHFYTTNPAEENPTQWGYKEEPHGPIYAWTSNARSADQSSYAARVPVYRFYDERRGSHLYTFDRDWADTHPQWAYERISFWVAPSEWISLSSDWRIEEGRLSVAYLPGINPTRYLMSSTPLTLPSKIAFKVHFGATNETPLDFRIVLFAANSVSMHEMQSHIRLLAPWWGVEMSGPNRNPEFRADLHLQDGSDEHLKANPGTFVVLKGRTYNYEIVVSVDYVRVLVNGDLVFTLPIDKSIMSGIITDGRYWGFGSEGTAYEITNVSVNKASL